MRRVMYGRVGGRGWGYAVVVCTSVEEYFYCFDLFSYFYRFP